MPAFLDFLRERIAADGFTTEDALAAFLPLMRQTVDAHNRDHVAPLEGVERLTVEDGVIGFDDSLTAPPRHNDARVQSISVVSKSAVEIVGETRVVAEVESGQQQTADASIGRRGEEITRPVYLPGYVSWEHEVDCHDPVTDVFSLGLILASLSCNLDLTEPADIERFVAHRGNLFAINDKLHPVVAKAIVKMTELLRHNRPQESAALLASLENYREQPTDIAYDLASTPGFVDSDRRGKQQIVLSTLQQRLFELSRRNRLLQFRATMQTVNLTWASVPLSFDPGNIRPDEILTWNDNLRKLFVKGKAFSLNKYLRFEEAVYLPGTLDRIRSEARRDMNEYGFAHLRLVACFLRWTNLKESPHERYESPLVLLPVSLTKKKGVRDTFYLEPLSSEAEVNPVVRYCFKEYYGLDLPERINLNEADLDTLYDYLNNAIHATEPAVDLVKIDRPRLRLIHARARRRLDQYRRRARVSGRGVRTFMDLDYSYQPENFHPLGLRIFDAMVRRPQTSLEAIIEDLPERANVQNMAREGADSGQQTADSDGKAEGDGGRADSGQRRAESGREAESRVSRAESEQAPYDGRPRPSTESGTSDGRGRPSYGDSTTSEDTSAELPASPVVEKTRGLMTAERDDGKNPYRWEFDLCNVTLGSFRYRAMSLVRDYDELLANERTSASFESVFSLAPRSTERPEAEPPPLDERFHVVACDPTQAASVEFSKSGNSYIIQGPPGTGKSQTITNLIADYVARGKRVLFVCEKRAAIDVVYHRLKQVGLADLCCLIHDSQADKKAFVMDLKRTYESFLSPEKRRKARPEEERDRTVADVQRELAPLSRFHTQMKSRPAIAGVTLRELLGRAIATREHRPELEPAQRERLPNYHHWSDHADRLERITAALEEIQPDGVFAHHPAGVLSTKIADEDRPLEFLIARMQAARPLIDELEDAFRNVAPDPEAADTLGEVMEVVRYARGLTFLAERNHLALLDGKTEPARELAGFRRRRTMRTSDLETAREKTTAWKQKLTPEETEIALARAHRLEGSFFKFFMPSWWRLRGVMNRSYDFTSHTVKPSWLHVLDALQIEHEAARAVEAVNREAQDAIGFEGGFDEFTGRIDELRAGVNELPPAIKGVHDAVVASSEADETMLRLSELGDLVERLETELDAFLIGYEERTFPKIRTDMERIEAAFDDLPDVIFCLQELTQLPEPLQRALRTLPLTTPALEAAVAGQTVEDVFRVDRELNRFTGRIRRKCVDRVRDVYGNLYDVNANVVRDRVKRVFQEQVQLADSPKSQLTSLEQEFKRQYTEGRRVLEHEFGKQMRYKSIRDLASGSTGLVVRDLKPVWLMSPLSVSDTLPLEEAGFDVVIFDEASQITLEQAIPTIFRAEQAIVVGDEMQLPPTSFFSTKRSGDDDLLEFEADEGEVVEYDLGSNSLLNHAARNLPSTMLGRHYRSRSESLISFSNAAFYGGRLLTVPDEDITRRSQTGIVAETVEAGDGNVDELLARAVSFHHLDSGVYENRRNRPEADYIARLVRGLLAGETGLSIGIVAFSEAQQGEIEDALNRLADDDSEFRVRLEAELEREDDDQFVGLLIKNLENIQGDERDVVIMSVCYGHDPHGKMRMNFGPINQSGGEKRLNVAFSRSKHHMVLVSSIRHFHITNDYNDGANCLKNYLRYAEATSAGDEETVRNVLREMTARRGESVFEETPEPDGVALDLAKELAARGYRVDHNVGQSSFRCDLAVCRDGDPEYRAGVLLDSTAFYEQDNIIDVEVMRPRLLEAFGWRITTVLAKDWYEHREELLTRLIDFIENRAPEPDVATQVDAETEAEPVASPPEDSESNAETASEAANSTDPAIASPPIASPPIAMGGLGNTRYFELAGDRPQFWQITLNGKTVKTRSGTPGKKGQSRKRKFRDDATAQSDFERQIRDRVARGYVEREGE